MSNCLTNLIHHIKWSSDTGLLTCLSPLFGLQDLLPLLDWPRIRMWRVGSGTRALLLQGLHSGSGKPWVRQGTGCWQSYHMQPPCSGLLESPQMLWVSCPESQVNSSLTTRRTEVLYLCSGLEERHFFIAFRTFPQRQRNCRKLYCNMVIASQYVQACQDSVYRRLTFEFLRAIFLASHQSL